MLYWIIFSVSFLVLLFLSFNDILSLRPLWVFLAIIIAIVLIVMGLTQLFTPQSTIAFKAKYTTHVQYIQSIQGKKISNKERMEEINSIYYFNTVIYKSRETIDDFWGLGPWTKNIADLEPLDCALIPEAEDVNAVSVTRDL